MLAAGRLARLTIVAWFWGTRWRLTGLARLRLIAWLAVLTRLTLFAGLPIGRRRRITFAGLLSLLRVGSLFCRLTLFAGCRFLI